MTIKTFNWCTATQLDCGGTIPATAYLCVPASIVNEETESEHGYVTATLDAARASTCADPCGLCKWVYTFSYDDAQLLPGYALVEAYVNSVLCGSCLIDFIVNQGSANFCWTDVTTEEQLLAVNDAGTGGALIGGNLVLSNDLNLVVPTQILPCGSINTNGSLLGIEAPFAAYKKGTSLIADIGDVTFGEGAVDRVFPEWFGAVNDGVVDSTNAINKALASTTGIVQLTHGTYVVIGILIPNVVSFIGDGFQTVIRNTSPVNHTISYTGAISPLSSGIKIADLTLEHTGGDVNVDGIHIVNVSSFVRIERVAIEDPPRHGIYWEATEDSHRGALYSKIDQVRIEGAGFDGVFLNGSINAMTIIGGRFGSNGRYGLNIDDTITGTTSFPNSLTVLNTDLPGNDYGLHENGHSNRYIGVRFEANSTGDILFGAKSQAAMFFGEVYGSGSGVISGTPLARPNFYSKAFSIRQFEDDGFLEYYDEDLAGIRKAPKRSVYNISVGSTSAGTTITNRPVSRIQDRIKIKRVSIIPDAVITGANTNNMQFQLRNKKAGGGDVAVAFQTFTLGVNVALLEDFALTISLGNENVVDGDVFYFVKNENGGGMASPNIMVQIEYGGY